MNVKEYIESGIVELYAMNALTSDEKKEFERLRLMYPEIGEELIRIEKDLEDFAFLHAINPRPQLRRNIMDTLKKEDKKGKAMPFKKETDDQKHSLTYKYLIAASLAALVISTFASWFFYNRWNDAEERYSVLLSEKNELAINFNVVKATYDETLANVLVLRDELSTVITLQSTDTIHNYKARVYWNKFNQHAYIDVLSMPEPEEGKQFQLWALHDGKPIDAGIILTNQRNIQRVKDISKADVWAITLELKGGSAVPTLDQIYLTSQNN